MTRPLVRPVLLAALVAAALAPSHAAAQLIHLRTVPVASGDQFLFLPTSRLAMGGVTVAVDDSLADPWSQPAKGVFIDEPAFVGTPTFYGISQNGGGGRTLPVAGYLKGDGWFGGIAVALQEIDNGDGRLAIRPDLFWPRPTDRLSDRSSRNLYARGFVGWRLGRGPWSLGIGASTASLNAMDGVDLLYADAASIDQEGNVRDVRVGLFHDGPRDRFSLSLAHHRVSMTHDVMYVDPVFVDPLLDIWPPPPVQPTVRFEEEEDRTRTWAGSVSWERSLAAPGWRLGGGLTFNRKSHPKIPNYQIQNIPRDPGDSWAWEARMGASRASGASLFAIDVAVQPVTSETWQEADLTIATSDGRRFRPGDRTIENDFSFLNVFVRSGWEYTTERAAFQLGVEVRSYQYDLEQRDNVVRTFRTQDEAWMEWTPSFGTRYRLDDVELSYLGRITTGTGRPGTDLFGFGRADDSLASAPTDFLLAPQGPLTLRDATVVTHQLSVRVPVR